jgi:exopolysaccharide biosynthesis polyprenyl glycosylphosphotransferase
LQWLQPAVFRHPYEDYIWQQLLFNGCIAIGFYQTKVWVRRRGEFWVDELSRIVAGTATGTMLMIAYIFVDLPIPFSRLFWFWVPLFTVVGMGLARLGRRVLLQILYQRGQGVDKALIIGAGDAGRSVMQTLLARPDLGYKAIGFLASPHAQTAEHLGSERIPNLGTWHDLPTILGKHPDLHTIFIALPAHEHGRTAHILQTCQEAGLEVQIAPDLLQLSFSKVEANNMGGIPMLTVREVRMSRAAEWLKRLVDVVLVLIAAVPTLFIGLLIALAIKLTSPGPIFYTGVRVGKEGRPFRMIKFRSMVVDAENQKIALQQMNEASGPIFKIRDDPRLTRIGRIIRRLSLDELPQLFNVLRGEMSLVGPRPPLPEEVAQYQEWHTQRLAVLGGLTGLWQVSGRSDLTFDEQCLLDIYYIENWSLSLDIRIMLQTIPYALFGRGAY